MSENCTQTCTHLPSTASSELHITLKTVWVTWTNCIYHFYRGTGNDEERWIIQMMFRPEHSCWLHLLLTYREEVNMSSTSLHKEKPCGLLLIWVLLFTGMMSSEMVTGNDDAIQCFDSELLCVPTKKTFECFPSLVDGCDNTLPVQCWSITKCIATRLTTEFTIDVNIQYWKVHLETWANMVAVVFVRKAGKTSWNWGCPPHSIKCTRHCYCCLTLSFFTVFQSNHC